ncbi:MAG TPA: manganese transporter, partial [Dehalococcoidia bacterium]|nr:manganese transporter [Dehalococcoidia bacterium]
AVQALAGLLLPSATVFLLLLCNDPAVLGPWVNRPWLNALASVILAVLLLLSMVLVVTTIFADINIGTLLVVLSALLAVGLMVMGVAAALHRPPRAPRPADRVHREDWRMPPLALLSRPVWSAGRRIAMYALSAYLVVAILMLFVKAVEIAIGH